MAKKIIEIQVDGSFTVEVTVIQTRTGYTCTDVVGDYSDDQLNIIYLALNGNEAVLENLWSVEPEDDEPLDAYLNLKGLTTKKIEEEANEILAGTGLKAFVFETSEEYEASDESDALYDGLPMFEAYLVHDASEDDLENTTTGRYCDLQSVREEILATARSYVNMTIGVIREEDSDRVQYMAVGKVEDGLFSGIVYAYNGGGCYETEYVYKGKWIPSEDHEGEVLDDDWKEDMLKRAAGSEFVTSQCTTIKEIYLELDEDGKYTVKDPELFAPDALVGFGKKFDHFPSLGFAGMDDDYETYTGCEFLFEAFEPYALARDVVVHQHEMNPDLHSSTLVEETINSFINDEVYGGLFDDEADIKIREYLDAIFKEMENRGLTIDDLDFKQCDICTNCKKVLLPDDELYESPISGSLCSECSIMCDGCDLYHAPKEIQEVGSAKFCEKCASDPRVYEDYRASLVDLDDPLEETPEVLCPYCLEYHQFDPDTHQCNGCGEVLTDSFVSMYKENRELKKRLAECESNRTLYGVFVLDEKGIDRPIAYGDKSVAERIAVQRANSFEMTLYSQGESKKITFENYSELEKFNEKNDFDIKIFIEEIELGVEE